MRLDNFLLRQLKNVPKSRIYKIIRSGEVRINKGRAKPARRLERGDTVRVPPVLQPAANTPDRPPDALMARVQEAIWQQTADYIIFAKPAGLAVHAGSGLRFGLIEVLRALRPGEYFELVHRLDRHTSGCLLVARSRQALDELRTGLNAADAIKRYTALLSGRWCHGVRRVDVPLSRDAERGGERMVVVDHQQGRSSLSTFYPLQTYADASLMEVEIRTGRTHQIRVHAAHCGHPVIGDEKYGSNAQAAFWRERGMARMALHAASISLYFQGQVRRFEVPLPPDMARLVERLDES